MRYISLLLICFFLLLPVPIRAQEKVTEIDTINGILPRKIPDPSTNHNVVSIGRYNPLDFIVRTIIGFADSKEVRVPEWNKLENQWGDGMWIGANGGRMMPLALYEQYKPPKKDGSNDLYPQFVGKYCNPNKLVNADQTRRTTNQQMIVATEPDKEFQDWLVRNNFSAAGLAPAHTTYLETKTPSQPTYTRDPNTGAYIFSQSDGILPGENCDLDAFTRPVPDRPLGIAGSSQGDQGNRVVAPLVDIQTIGEAIRRVQICLSNFKECLDYGVNLATNPVLYTIAPGTPANAALAVGSFDDSNVPPGVPENSKSYLTSKLGFTNRNLPLSVKAQIVPSVEKGHGGTNSTAQANVSAGGSTAQGSVSQTPWLMVKAVKDSFRASEMCAPMTLTSQKKERVKCTFDDIVQEIPPTSNWAVGDSEGGTGSGQSGYYKPRPVGWCQKSPTLGTLESGLSYPLRPDSSTNNPYMQSVMAEAAKGKIPLCVLEGVAMIEGGYHWQSLDNAPLNACLPNMWGAAGPFQITINRDTCGGNCESGAGYCPNTWGSRPGSPCNAEEAAAVAVDILQKKTKAAFGPGQSTCPNATQALPDMTDGPWQQQQGIIEKATCHYYGSNARHARLGNRSYHEFVIDHCRAFPNGYSSSNSGGPPPNRR